MRRSGIRRRKALRRFYRKLILARTVIMISVISVPGITLYARSAHEKPPVYKYYTDIRVQSGDTLTSIAGRYYTTDFGSRSAYIDEVRFINHLDSDRIDAGRMLIVPYYSAIEKH